MGRIGAFLEIEREEHGQRPVSQRLADWDEYISPLPLQRQCTQASRCMNCGVAFCQSGLAFPGSRKASGCPLHNLIPETNDLLCRGRMQEAAERLALTNPFPEFTGRVCPAPCETACNLGLHDDAVSIHDNERAISDWSWEAGMAPLPQPGADAPLVSIAGSGPAGLACAWALAQRGARVRVFERDEAPGGLLMYGIPSMKMPKDIVSRRISLMEDSGIEFVCRCDAAAGADGILEDSEAVVLAVGAREERDLDVEGRGLDGIHFALEFLGEATRSLLERRRPAICASGKDVVVIGGGDTGVDCIATAVRQGARSVTQLIRAARPSDAPRSYDVWPKAAASFSRAYGHAEALEAYGHDPRVWSTDVTGFSGCDGRVNAVSTQLLSYEGGRHRIDGTQDSVDAQLVVIAKGFTGMEKGVGRAFGLDIGSSGKAERTYGKVFLAGDAFTGPSLVSASIADGLACAKAVAEKLAL